MYVDYLVTDHQSLNSHTRRPRVLFMSKLMFAYQQCIVTHVLIAVIVVFAYAASD